MVRKKTVQQSLFLDFQEPWQRGLAIALGLTLGLLPKFSLIFPAVLLVTLFCPVSLTLTLAIGCLVSLISPQLSGLQHLLGSWILGHSRLQGIWESLFSIAVFRAIGFQNSQIMGGLLLALGSFYPTYLLTTIYFQRRRQLDVDKLFSPASEAVEVSPQSFAVAPIHSITPPPRIDKTVVDTVLSERVEPSIPGSESLVTAHLMALPAIEDQETSLEAKSQFTIPEPTQASTEVAPDFPTRATSSTLIYSEDDIAEAERILNELVSAKQQALHQHTQDGSSSATTREIEEQQWVLDTLIEIIRLKDEAVKSQETPSTESSQRTMGSTMNLLAPLAGMTEVNSTQTDPSSNTNPNLPNRTPESSMDKLSRTDAGVSSGTVNAIGSSEQVERMSTSPPSPVNVVPHSARPRSMHARDESLRFLIHHLQCLQREREE